MTPKQTDEPDIDDKAMWRIGNEIVSEEALLEFADDFDE